MRITNTRTALAVTAFLAVPVLSQAALITGNLAISGTVNVSQSKIDFVPTVVPSGGTISMPGSGAFAINLPASAQTGGFTALAGTTGAIENIENSFAPVGTSIAEMNFLTFAAAPNISFELTLVLPGLYGTGQCLTTPAAPGQNCTPSTVPVPPNAPTSPENLTNLTATSSFATFGVSGLELDSLTGTSTPFTGLFSTQFPNLNYQQLLGIVAGGGTVSTSYSASFTVTNTIPEPGALVQMLSGACLLGLGGLARRRTRAKA